MDAEPESYWSSSDPRYSGSIVYSAPALHLASFDARQNAHSIPIRHFPTAHYHPVRYSPPTLRVPVEMPSEINKNYMSPPRHKAHLIPVEIFSEIFLYTVQADPHSRVKLMLVSRHVLA